MQQARLINKTSRHIAMHFENTWLSRYPWPLRCVRDQGKEFIGFEFLNMLRRNNIQSVPTTVKNPQGNSICEQMHQTMASQLRSLIHGNPPQNLHQANEIIDTALAATIFALRTAAHNTLHTAPGSIVYNRDLLLNIPFIADLPKLQQNRQQVVDSNLQQANLRRHDYDYTIGGQVLIKTVDPNKLQEQYHGPYPIRQVHANGNVTIQLRPGITERINIRRIKAYRG